MRCLPKYDDPGHAHFVTTNTSHRQPLFLANDTCMTLLCALDAQRQALGFRLYGFVVMPDHIHLLLLPPPEVSITTIVQRIKGRAAWDIRDLLSRPVVERSDRGALVVSPDRLRNACATTHRRLLGACPPADLDQFRVVGRSGGIAHQFWQAGFYDFNVFSPGKVREKLDYMHGNPVAWGLVDSPEQYAWSSYGHYEEGGQAPFIAVDDPDL
jgi:putative transposase